MKFLHAAAFAVALTLTSAPALRAQQPDQDKEKQQGEEKKKQPADKEKEKPQPKADDRANPKQQPDKDKPGRETDRRDQQPQRQDEHARQDKGAHRIPDEKFHANFGEQHHFHVSKGGDRRIAYGGYSFEYVEAWPAEWSYDDDVYIVLIGDDYYLVDVRHPGVRLRLILVD